MKMPNLIGSHIICELSLKFSSVQSLSHVQLFGTPWIAAHQASLSITNSRSSLKLMCIESVMLSKHLILSPLSPALSVSQHQHLFMCYFNLTNIGVSVQFSSVAQSCPTLCDPINRSTPVLPVHHQLPEFTQAHVHRVGDAIQPSHPRSSPSPPAPIPPSIRVFSNESTLRMRWPKYWSFSFSIIPSKEIPGLISFRMD